MSSYESHEIPAASHSTAAVARRLGVSIPTVQRWVDQGVLKAWKTVGGHRRIDAASVERFIRSREGVDPLPAVAAATTVLIVEDNPDDRDLLAALVEFALPEAEITLAENGFDALLGVGRRMPDLLITDIVMPHMDGLAMLRHLATQCATRPRVVVAVSSCAPAQLAALGGLPADVGFCAKPVDAECLVPLLLQTGQPVLA
jgi:excisionase family DNA binding protein